MVAVATAAAVAVEHRREHMPRQYRGNEQRMTRQRIGHALRQPGEGRRIWRKLQILLEARRLRAGRLHAVDPGMGRQFGA
ncbi:hypothetical protein D3C71_1783810 [compost metagenome]